MSCPMFINIVAGVQYSETGCGHSVQRINVTEWKFCPWCGGEARPITDAELTQRALGNNWNETVKKEEE